MYIQLISSPPHVLIEADVTFFTQTSACRLTKTGTLTAKFPGESVFSSSHWTEGSPSPLGRYYTPTPTVDGPTTQQTVYRFSISTSLFVGLSLPLVGVIMATTVSVGPIITVCQGNMK